MTGSTEESEHLMNENVTTYMEESRSFVRRGMKVRNSIQCS